MRNIHDLAALIHQIPAQGFFAESIRLRAALKQRELSGIDHWVSARSTTID